MLIASKHPLDKNQNNTIDVPLDPQQTHLPLYPQRTHLICFLRLIPPGAIF